MRIVIEGAGEVGRHLAKMLSNEANDITVIDPDQAKLAKVRALADVITVPGTPATIKILKEAGTANADLFIAVNPSTEQDVNIVSAMLAKHLGAKKVTARIDDEEFLEPENKLMFKEMGIELMFHPEKIAADEIVSLLKHTASTESMDFARGKLQMAVFKLEEDSRLIGMKLAEFSSLATGEDTQFRVVALSSGGKTIMPKPDYKFRYHDLVFIMAKKEGIQEIMNYLGKSNIEVNKVMILGGSLISELVAKQLIHQIDDIKIIDNDKQRCVELSERLDATINVVYGDGRNSDFLLEENIKEYDAFLALTGNDEANILACVVAKQFGIERTIAEVENIEYIRLAEEQGVDAVINKKLLTAGKIFRFTLSGKARTVKYMSGTDAEVLEYTAGPGSPVTKAPLKDIGFPRDAVIGGVIRGRDSFIAVGNTQIEEYDRVAVFALPSAVKEVD
ncbi:MAG: Trk system potassium transporter TrkA, partial [Bacteroidales bacterium]|nr:Trk system potassium transporter TrkA [Bacteroidales bacterium]